MGTLSETNNSAEAIPTVIYVVTKNQHFLECQNDIKLFSEEEDDDDFLEF